MDWIKFYGTTMMYSGLPLFFWNRPKWTEKDMVDQRGKVRAVLAAAASVAAH